VIAISGRRGLVGWHLRAFLHSRGERWVDVDLRVGRTGPTAVELHGVTRAVHVAGITRGTDHDLHAGNIALAQRFVDTIDRSGSRPAEVVYANSVQAARDTAYGRGKAGASAVLERAAARWGARYTDLPIENVFGEHGAPDHNTVTSTFCHRLAHGLPLPVDSDAERTFVHAQDVAEVLAGALPAEALRDRETVMTIPDLAERLGAIAAVYDRGEVPPITTAVTRDLFNTYRSFAFDVRPVHRLPSVTDSRGSFTELLRAHGGTGQTSVSTTNPGVTRGDHYHRRKTERFVVVDGTARITLRRLLTDDRRTFDVSGDDPVAIDMPTLWSHAITNTGPGPLTTVFWTDDLFDPADPDTHQEPA
jgi:UDP-2-acetamido-2,6-beta-L-arabino-hexul-4-ose reductase